MSDNIFIKAIACVIITLIITVAYLSIQPTNDEEIIKSFTAACIIEQKLIKFNNEVEKCINGSTNSTYRNKCLQESANKNGIPVYRTDGGIYKIKNSIFNKYDEYKKISMLPLKNGKLYTTECKIW